MKEYIKEAEKLVDFIHQSSTMYHVVGNMASVLESNGFKPLFLKDKWQLEKGGRYYVTKNGSAIFAFILGGSDLAQEGFRFVAAHSDSPCFRIKPDPEMVVDGAMLKLNTEVYGGPILMTWLDRPLSIAGRVVLRGGHPLHPKKVLVDVRRPLGVIPSLAIHMNRAVNEGVELNKQKDMLPLLGMIDKTFNKEGFLLSLIADELKVDKIDILDCDLFLYETERGTIFGPDQDMILSPKLDDLAMAFAGLEALIGSASHSAFNMLCIFDNEEVGSGTKQGAGSPVLKHILERIADQLGLSREDYQRMLYHSFMISSDMAHALHPNQPEKHDPVLHPVINGGPVIKLHAGQKYMTDGDSGAVFVSLCESAGVPCQKFVNRSDMVGGSTLGNILTGQIDIRGVDIGNPMLGMHSARETGGVMDHHYIKKVFTKFFTL